LIVKKNKVKKKKNNKQKITNKNNGSSILKLQNAINQAMSSRVLFSNLSCPTLRIDSIPTQPLVYMVQHVTDWVAPFPVVGISLPSNSSIFRVG